MKKLLGVSLLVVALAFVFVPVVNAATTAATLSADLLALGSNYGMTAEDKLQIERYLSEHTIDDTKAAAVYAKAEEAIAVLETAGVTNYDELDETQKAAFKADLVEAGAIVDLTVTFEGKKAIVKDAAGKTIVELENNDGKIKYTGSNVNAYIIVPVVAIVALAIAVVAKKRLADAE